MKKKAVGMILCAAMMASLAGSGVSAAESGKHFTAGATTGFFGAESLDVAYNWDGWIMSIYGISENLFRLDANYVPQPWLAESYENVDDLTWKFTIRDGVTFSDGNPVTAEAVKKCFERTYANNDRAGSTLAISSMEADGQVLTIATETPNPTILNDLCDPLLGIYDADKEADPELGVSCTGPFVATSFSAMSEVQMEKNENYWGGTPKVDTVDLKIIDDTEALNMALQNGEIDLIAQLPASGTKIFENNENITMDSATSTRANFLMYNLEHSRVDDVNVRNAIGMCVDRESFADVVYNGYATASYGIYPETLPYGSTEGMENAVTSYDPEGAAELLKEAGYEDTDNDGILDKDGEPLSLHAITYSYNTECLQLADMMQAELGAIGIDMQIETFDVLDDPLANGEFDVALLNYAMAPTGSAQYMVSMMFETGSSNNYGHYSNATVDELSEKLKATFDETERTDIAKQICAELVKDRAFDFVADQQLICAYSKKVSGFEINPTEYYLITNNIDIEE